MSCLAQEISKSKIKPNITHVKSGAVCPQASKKGFLHPSNQQKSIWSLIYFQSVLYHYYVQSEQPEKCAMTNNTHGFGAKE